jgi:molybdopterin converting factor small subunit
LYRGDQNLIKVEVRLYGSLKEYLQGAEADRPFVIELRDETTIEQLITALGIPAEEVVVTLVNSIAKSKNYYLKDRDVIDAFPPPIGG